jgi:hypothetical protein
MRNKPWGVSQIQGNKRMDSKPFLRGFLSVILIASYFACWSLATPVGSAPDDGYHLSSIWCVNSSEKECKSNESIFTVPTLVAGTNYKCFAQDGQVIEEKYNKSAKCIEVGIGKTSQVSYLNNNTAMYPEIFYLISSIFVGESVELSVLNIRIFWGLVFSILFMVALANISIARQKALKLTYLIYLTPVAAFLIGSTNPSSGSIIGLSLLPAFLDLCLSRSREKRLLGLVLVLVASLLASGSRADGGLFIFLIVAGWLIARANKESIKELIAPSLLASFTALTLTLLVLSKSKSVGLQAVAANPTNSIFTLDSLIYNSTHLYKYYLGFWGLDWSLGWKFEPKLTQLIPITQGVIAFSLLMLFVRLRNRKSLLLVGYILIIGFIIPIYMFQVSGSRIGEFVQPRYMLPFALAATYLMLANYPRNNIKHQKILINLAATSFFFVNIITFYSQVTRVSRGADGNIFAPMQSSDWWWQLGVIPAGPLFVVFIFSTLTFSLILINGNHHKELAKYEVM